MSEQWPPPGAAHGNAGGVPAQAAVAAPKKRSRLLFGLTAVVVALVAGAAGAFIVLRSSAAAADVILHELGQAGDDAFTSSVAPEPSATLSDFAEAAPTTTVEISDTHDNGYLRAPGDIPGVFGGTLNEQACDKAQLVTFLTTEPDKAALWASVLSIDVGDITAYVNGLTGANLGYDTRVLDHGFLNGELVPREALLQRGSAVLIDSRGVPRVNCYSGNPLLDPIIDRRESYVGTEWTGFERTLVVVVVATPADENGFTLVDVATGELFDRPSGTTGEADATASDTTVDQAAASSFELGTRVPLSIADQPEIRFEFEAPSSSTITFTVDNNGDSARSVAAEMTDDGERLSFVRVAAGGTETTSWTFDDDGGGIVELIFTEGPAEFGFQVDVEGQNDGGQGGDAGDEISTAFAIASGSAISGAIANVDTGDLYTLPVSGGEVLTFASETAREAERSIGYEVKLNGERLYFVRVPVGGSDEFNVILGPDDVGLVEVLVTEGPGSYAFTASIADQNDGGGAGDVSNELAEALVLTDTALIEGEIGDRDPGDLYLFEAAGDQLTVEITIAPTAVRPVGVEVVGPDGARLVFVRVPAGVTMIETISTTAGEGHRLGLTEGRGEYSVSITSP